MISTITPRAAAAGVPIGRAAVGDAAAEVPRPCCLGINLAAEMTPADIHAAAQGATRGAIAAAYNPAATEDDLESHATRNYRTMTDARPAAARWAQRRKPKPSGASGAVARFAISEARKRGARRSIGRRAPSPASFTSRRPFGNSASACEACLRRSTRPLDILSTLLTPSKASVPRLNSSRIANADPFDELQWAQGEVIIPAPCPTARRRRWRATHSRSSQSDVAPPLQARDQRAHSAETTPTCRHIAVGDGRHATYGRRPPVPPKAVGHEELVVSPSASTASSDQSSPGRRVVRGRTIFTNWCVVSAARSGAQCIVHDQAPLALCLFSGCLSLGMVGCRIRCA